MSQPVNFESEAQIASSMKSAFCLFVCAVIVTVLSAPRPAFAIADRIRLVRGNEIAEVSDMTPTVVTITKGVAASRPLAVNQIKSVQFEGEPSELSQARVSIA